MARRTPRVPAVHEDIFEEAPVVVETVVVSETVPRGRAGRTIAGIPSTVHLEDALTAWGLDPAEVLAWRGAPEAGLCVVTVGGAQLHWPQGMGRVLTDAEKGRARVPEAARTIFTETPR